MENVKNREVLASEVRFTNLLDYIKFHIQLLATVNNLKLTERSLLILSCAVYLTMKYGENVDVFKGRYFNEIVRMTGLSKAIVRNYISSMRKLGFIIKDEYGADKVLKDFIPEKTNEIIYFIKVLIDEDINK